MVGTGGVRTLTAALDNQGTVTVHQGLTLNRSDAQHTNTGLVDLTTGDLTVSQTGTAPSFTNTGTMTVGLGRTLAVTGGTFGLGSTGTLNGGGAMTLSGVNANFLTGFTLGALTAANSTVGFSAALSTASTALAVNNSTINGPGTVTNAAGQTLTVNYGVFNAPLDNQGTLVTNGTVNVNGAFANSPGAVLRLQPDGSTGFATVTAATGFTNQGAIELTSIVSTYSATLAVAGGGTLTNAAGATIAALAGTGGTRTINALVDNQGTLDLFPGSAGRLTVNGGLITSGSINVELGGTTQATQYDHLQVLGSASIGGTMNLALISAFAPTSGTQFDVVTTTGSATGSMTLGTQPGGWSNPAVVPTAVRLTAP